MKGALKVKRILALVVLSILTLVGCGYLVVDKQFIPEHIVEWTTYTKIGDIMVPQHHTRNVPNDWVVTIQCLNDDGRTTSYSVDSTSFERIEIGEYYQAGESSSHAETRAEHIVEKEKAPGGF